MSDGDFSRGFVSPKKQRNKINQKPCTTLFFFVHPRNHRVQTNEAAIAFWRRVCQQHYLLERWLERDGCTYAAADASESIRAILTLYPESQQLQVIRESIIELLPQTGKSEDTKQLHSPLHSDNRVEQREAKRQRLEETDSLTEAESVTTVRIAFNLE